METGIQCPSGRISELRDAGVEFEELGKVKYPGAQPFTKYGIKKRLTKRVQEVNVVDGVAVETFKEVAI